MEKIVYALWRDPAEPRDTFNARLLGPVADALKAHAISVRVNVQDEAVEGGASPRMTSTAPPMEAFVQLWVDSAHHSFRAPIDAALQAAAPRIEGWLVSESVPLANRDQAADASGRTPGFSQMVFLGRPRRAYGEWLHNWQGLHTPVATETQSNFEYIQNLIVRPLTPDSGDYAAIVEECFPAAAFTDEAAYYDAVGEPERLERHKAEMATSCARFVELDAIDCIPTSQFDVKPLRVNVAVA